jgi:4-hydroxy-3-methylbut-2-enyl diphosphate reductase (EC 1.17.1.2)
MRLVEVANRAGCRTAMLVQKVSDIPWDELREIRTLGLTAGASAPEVLVNDIIEAFRQRYTVKVETVTTATEDITFKLPRALHDNAA